MRNAVFKSVINYYLSDQGIQITCLQSDINWQNEVHITEMCFTTPTINATLKDAVWKHNERALELDELNLEHFYGAGANNQDAANQTTFSVNMLANVMHDLPLISIRKLQIRSPLLSSALTLKLELNRSKELKVNGDIQAKLQVKDANVSASIDWRLGELQFVPVIKTLITENPTLFNDTLLDNPISSVVTFDGKTIDSQHTVSLSYPTAVADCQLDFKFEGNIGLKIENIATIQNMQADFVDLDMRANVPHCTQIPATINSWQLTRFSLQAPQLISFAKQKINIPELVIQQIGPFDNKQAALQLAFVQLSADIVERNLSSKYSLLMSQALPLTTSTQVQFDLHSEGSLSAKADETSTIADSQWQVTANNKLSLKAARGKQLSIQSSQLDFTLEANQDSGAQLIGNVFGNNIELNGLSSSTFSLDNFKGDFAAVLSPDLHINSNVSITANALSAASLQSAITTAHLNVVAQLNREAGLSIWERLNAIEISGKVSASGVTATPISIDRVQAQFTLAGASARALELSLQHQTRSVTLPALSLRKVEGDLTATWSNSERLIVSGRSYIFPNILHLEPFKLKLENIGISHSAETDLTLQGSASQHLITLGSQFNVNVTQNANELSLCVDQQSVTGLNKILSQVLPSLRLSQGNVSAQMQTKIGLDQLPRVYLGDIQLNKLDGNYDNTLFNGVSLNAPFIIDDSTFTLSPSNLSIVTLNAGVPIENITARLLSDQGSLKLSRLDGALLGGNVTLQNMWLDKRQQTFDLVLQDLDLEKIVALQNQPGIKVTGKIMGRLPFEMTDTSLELNKGEMLSQNGGRLIIKNNPAFDSIKKQQAKLSYLEDYEFSQLSSKVTLQPDGLMLLGLSFVGKNETQKQAVNFNYSHQENIFALLRSLRVANGVQETIEKRIIQGTK